MAMTRGILMDVLVPVFRKAGSKMGLKCAKILVKEIICMKGSWENLEEP